jgi:hypothetical protein
VNRDHGLSSAEVPLHETALAAAAHEVTVHDDVLAADDGASNAALDLKALEEREVTRVVLLR